jgi:hypothetical protein
MNGAIYGGWICNEMPRRHPLHNDIAAAASPASGCRDRLSATSFVTAHVPAKPPLLCTSKCLVARQDGARQACSLQLHPPGVLHSDMRNTPYSRSDRHLPTSALSFGTNLPAAAAIAGELVFIRRSPSQLAVDVPSWTWCGSLDFLHA